MWEYELIYNQTSTDDGTPEGRKIPQSNPGSTAGVAVASLGADPELYRHHWLIKNNKELDDYASLIPVVTAIGQPASAQFIAETNALLDVDEWLRTFAVQVLFGVGDNYAFGAQHNMLIYIRPTDGKAMYMPWDMDFTFSQGATASLTPSGDLNKLLTDTGNRRAYYGHLLDIMDTTFNAAYLGPWADHYSCFAPGSPLDGFIATLTARESYARAQIATLFPATSFAITTNGGAAFSVADSQVTLAGDGWVDVREIRLAGGGALPLTWTDDNSWELEVPLGAGANTITLEAYGFGGQLLGTASIDVTNTSAVQAAAAGNIAITEVMYHPLPATPAEAAALPGILNPQEEFEFIEIQNISGTAVDLSGCAFTNGIDFAFDDGTTLAAGARLLVVGNLDAFRARYGTGLDSLIAGAFASGRLSNSGDRLTLTGAGGADVASFSYSDGGAWPGPADGQGASLILVNPDPATDHELPQSWWSSAVSGGEPGSGKSPTYAHWALGKFSAAQLADPAISGLLADPDLDGQPNMVECAANGDPLSGSSLNNLAAGITDLGSGPQPALRFTSANAGDIRLGVLESDDAVHFGIIGDYFLPAAGDDNGDGTWGHEVIDPDTLADAARKIYVLEAQWIWTE
ncbi:MAG: lamin tail domain-containing protein [Verrucomicrobiales bacterium]